MLRWLSTKVSMKAEKKQLKQSQYLVMYKLIWGQSWWSRSRNFLLRWLATNVSIKARKKQLKQIQYLVIYNLI
jgi:hypothetical protein